MHKSLAKVRATFLGVQDHGIFTASLRVDYADGGSQSVGNYALDEPTGLGARRIGTAYGMEFIIKVLRACNVSSWEQLPGSTIYVLHESESYDSKVIGIQGVGFGSETEPFYFASLTVVE